MKIPTRQGSLAATRSQTVRTRGGLHETQYSSRRACRVQRSQQLERRACTVPKLFVERGAGHRTGIFRGLATLTGRQRPARCLVDRHRHTPTRVHDRPEPQQPHAHTQFPKQTKNFCEARRKRPHAQHGRYGVQKALHVSVCSYARDTRILPVS